MAEAIGAIGIAAAVLQLAGNGMKLSMTIHEIGATMANAGVQIAAVAQSIQLFSSTLRHVGYALRQSEPVHSQDAEDTAQEVMILADSVFNDIRMMISQVDALGRVQRLSIVMRVKWCFRKAKVDYLLCKLDSLKLTLSLMLQTISIANTMALFNRQVDSRANLQAQVEQGKEELCSWMITRHWSLVKLTRLRQAAVEEYREELLPDGDDQRDDDFHQDGAFERNDNEIRALVPFIEQSMSSVNGAMGDIRDPSRQLIPRTHEMVDHILHGWTNVREDRRRPRETWTHAGTDQTRRRSQQGPRIPRPQQRAPQAGYAPRSSSARSGPRRRQPEPAGTSYGNRPDIAATNGEPKRTSQDPRSQPQRQHQWKAHEATPIRWKRGSAQTNAWREFLNEDLHHFHVPKVIKGNTARQNFGKDTWTEISDEWVLAEALELWQYPFRSYDRLRTTYPKDRSGRPVGDAATVTQRFHHIENALDFGEILDLVELTRGLHRHRQRPDRSPPSVLSSTRPKRPTRLKELLYPAVHAPKPAAVKLFEWFAGGSLRPR